MVGQRAEVVVLSAETKSADAMQRRFQSIFFNLLGTSEKHYTSLAQNI
jgi:hypothetical protein